jgi:hypothetical protein
MTFGMHMIGKVAQRKLMTNKAWTRAVRNSARIKYKLMGFSGLFSTYGKINTCYYTTYFTTYLHMGKGQKRMFAVTNSSRICQQRNHCDFQDGNFPAILAVRLAVSWNSSLQCAHNLSNVHSRAMFFLRHLANMSFMVSFWASTGLGSVPIWGGGAVSEATPSRGGCS